MNETTFTYDKSSNPPPASWSDDGRINVFIFPDVQAFQAFLKGLGISTQLINGGAAIKGTQLAGVVGTYVTLVGLITLQILWKKHSITHDNGLKKGHSTTLSTKQDKFYLVIFGNASWYCYYQGEMNSGGSHTIHVNASKVGTVS